ncbi:DNA polymerase-4 [Kytococcus aerolatus]|uniref:DNA polymerase IV n=1 Tax=Kytococcus aerolatus TaxID=592308 RepID=A0A212T3R4_9MICO|nr:DNA polymerase IV [Kytococcus aerolatus]SNC60659.1 DNA polymerase-4 [Kytococcus aerolatus]
MVTPEAAVLHVDMDAFYAAVSLVDRPELHGRPVIIGGGGRAVVLSATYEARALGVRSAMPMARARRLCPQAVVVHPDHDRYAAVSGAVMEVFRQVTPLVQPTSVDEAFLDLTGTARRWGTPWEVAEWLRGTVAAEQQITCSVGIAPNPFVAKVASGQAKPDGIRQVRPEEVVGFLHPLPVGVLWGVGERTQEQLARFGLTTVGQVAHTPRSTLQRIVGEATGAALAERAWGRDRQRVRPRVRERTIGNGQTFRQDVDSPEVVLRRLLLLSERVAARARAAGEMGRTVQLTVRFADFTTLSRSRTMARPSDVSREIFAAARQAFESLGLQRARVRMVRVTLSGLTPAGDTPVQGLLDEPEVGWREADRAVDRASARFGAGVIRPASLLPAAQEVAPA